MHLPLPVDAIGSIQEGTSRPSIKHKVYKWWKEYDDSVLWLFTSGRIFSSTPPLKTFSKSCGTSVTYEDYITRKIFILHWEADQTPGHHYPCAVPSQVGRGGASLPPDSVLFRFNSYLKNLISFTGCTVDITHSRALLTTCKSQRLQQSSTMQLMSALSVCHANDQKRTKGIEAKESKVICTSSPMLHEGKHEYEFAAVCKYFQNIQKGNLPLQSWSTAEKAT